MATAGRILIMPKGDWTSGTTYEMLDMVKYNGTSWIAKKTSVGIAPSKNSEYWHDMFDMGAYDELVTKVNSIPDIKCISYASGLIDVGTTDAKVDVVYTADKNCYVTATVTQLEKGAAPTKTKLRATKSNGDYKYQDADGVVSATIVCELEAGDYIKLVATAANSCKNEFVGRLIVVEM